MSTATKGKRPMRHLTASDKIDAIQRIHDGESKASVARDIGVPESTLRGWCKNEDKLRYMSRQSTPDSKIDKLTEDAVAAGLLGLSSAEKRMKLDTSLPLNFATNGGKLKYDELSFKTRHSINGLDLSNSRDLNGLSHSDFNSFSKSADLSSLNSTNKSQANYNLQIKKELSLKGYGADLSKPADPTKGDMSMAAISPLTSLSHLSGMSNLGQSPLALSFNEIATNLNLIAQFNNPNLAAMSGINTLNQNSQSLRNVRLKNSSINPNLSPRNNNIEQDKINQGLTVKNLSKLQKSDLIGMNLSDKSKKLSASPMPAINRDAPVDDALWYWLKSQQAMLGLNSLYSSITNQNNSSATALTQQTHQQSHNQEPHPPCQTPTPPTVASPQNTPPSSTPSAASDDTKNSSWFWQWYKTFGTSLLDKQNTNDNSGKMNSSYDNILYSQLTKETNSDNLHQSTPKPEDLSRHNNHNESQEHDDDHHPNSENNLPNDLSASIKTDHNHDIEKSPGKARAVLDDLLFNNNNNHNDNNNDPQSYNNNNNTIKTELDMEEIPSPFEAVEHGEKFLKWLESYSDPNVTAMQVMQFRFLLNTIKTSADRANNPSSGDGRIKIRRRK